MGFFDFFRRKKKTSAEPAKSVEPTKLVINIADTNWTINGVAFTVPCHLVAFEKAFGKPDRVFKGKNTIYTWDKLGIYCYAKAKTQTIDCFSIRSAHGDMDDMEYLPKNLFSGTLTFGGKNWEEVMYSGENVEGFFRKVVTEGLSIVSEYCDFDNADANGPHGAYVGVEISIRGEFEDL